MEGSLLSLSNFILLQLLLGNENKNQAAVLNWQQQGIKERCWRGIGALNDESFSELPVWLQSQVKNKQIKWIIEQLLRKVVFAAINRR